MNLYPFATLCALGQDMTGPQKNTLLIYNGILILCFCCTVDPAVTEGQLRHRRRHPRKLVWQQQIRLDLLQYFHLHLV